MPIFPNQLFVPSLAASAHKQNNCGLPCCGGTAHLGLAGSQQLGNTAPRGKEHQEDREQHRGSGKKSIK